MSAANGDDGVRRLPSTGISVLIAGAGIGGLFCALESYRQGHDIVGVLEKATHIETIGDAFSILPPALSTLRHFPWMKAEFEKTSHRAEMSVWRYEGRRISPTTDGEWNAPGAVHPAKDVYVPWIERRSDIVMMLYEQCRRLDIPIILNQHVTAYGENSERAWVTTKEGLTYSADVVVAADGVGTKSHDHVTGYSVPAVSSGYALYRVVIPMQHLLQRVSVECRQRYLDDARPQLRFVLAPDMHANLITTPDFAIYVLTHKDSGMADESWRATVSKEAVLDTLAQQPGWDPLFLEIVSATLPNSAVDWKLLWRDPQEHWTSSAGRVIQLGDSAHSFLPTSGNGATQAMEDGMSLAACLRLGGKYDVAQSTKAHVKLRFERVSTLQKFGFVTRQIWHHVDLDAAEQDPSLLQTNFGKWIWGHDPLQYAEQKFADALTWVKEGGSFESTNLPPNYTYKPWTVEDELRKERQGEFSQLKKEGDWSS